MSPSSMLGVGGVLQNGLLFLIKLAWDCRYRLPVLITVGFMVLDVRMQLEINVDIDHRNMQADDNYDDDDDEEEEEDSTDSDSYVTNEFDDESEIVLVEPNADDNEKEYRDVNR